MPTYSITITDEEDRILRSWLKDPAEWLDNAFRNKIRQRIMASVEEETNFNPKKLDEVERLDVLKDVELPLRIDRTEGVDGIVS